MIPDTIYFDASVDNMDNPWATILLSGHRLRFRVMHWGTISSGNRMGITDLSVVDFAGHDLAWPDELDTEAVIHTIQAALPMHWAIPGKFPDGSNAPRRPGAVYASESEMASRQGAIPL